MNTISQKTVDYLRGSRTIETIDLEGKNVYVYNYEGIHFRLFLNVLALIQFFEKGTEPKYCFETETELDDFLLNCNL